MGSNTSTLPEEEILQIEEDTGFTRNQIIRLHHRFTSLDRNGDGFLCEADFLKIPKVATNPLAHRIIYVFCNQNASIDDTFDSEPVNFRQFINTLSIFRPASHGTENKGTHQHNSRLHKLRFVFKLYDLENNDQISKDELIKVLHTLIGSNVSQEQLERIADQTFAEVDSNRSGFISFDEFVQAMHAVDLDQLSIHFLG